jgi:hypothetical protein
MLRKSVWITALLLALTFVFFGCDDSKYAPISAWTKNVLEIQTLATWAGLDIIGGTADTEIEFEEDDKIYIKGIMAKGGGQLLFNTNHSGWAAAGGWNPPIAAGESFEATITLTGANITAIAAASPKNLRLRGPNDNTVTFVVEELTYTKGTTKLIDLSADLAKLSKGALDDAGVKKIKYLQPAGTVGTNVVFTILGP